MHRRLAAARRWQWGEGQFGATVSLGRRSVWGDGQALQVGKPQLAAGNRRKDSYFVPGPHRMVLVDFFAIAPNLGCGQHCTKGLAELGFGLGQNGTNRAAIDLGATDTGGFTGTGE
jgi:hypothetical protein